MNLGASGASELRKLSLLLILKLTFPSIFCWYFRYFVGTNDILVGLHATLRNRFSGLQLHLNMQSMQFPFITYGMAL